MTQAETRNTDRFAGRVYRRLGQSIAPAFLVGLLVRLLMMPFAAHSDLMHIYWDAHQIAYHEASGFGLQSLLLYLHAAYLWFLAPILPHHDTLWIHSVQNPSLNPFLSPRVVSTDAWFEFISHPQVYRTLFLLKLPYLCLDVASASIAYRLGTNRGQARLLFKLWWFNPILLFVVYLYGRHEVVGLFFVLLSIFLIRRRSQAMGILALGVAIAIRYYAILLLPYYVLSIEPGWRKRIQRFVLGLIPWTAINLLTWTTTGSPEATTLLGIQHTNYLLSMKLPLAPWDSLYVFPLLYLLLLLHRLHNHTFGSEALQRYSLVGLLLLLATAYSGQSPQYWTWFLPLLMVEIVRDWRLLTLHIGQAACLLIYSFIGSRSTAGYLLAPLAPDFFWSLPSPIEVLGEFTSPELLIGLARTAMSAVTLWMAYLVFRDIRFHAPVRSVRGPTA